MTPKKDHEIDAMMAFINEMTRIHNIDVNDVLDVGCGLGYLSLELSKGGYNVVGVEGDPERAKKAAMHARFQCVTRKVYDCNDLEIMKERCISVSLRIFYFERTNLRCMWEFVVKHDPTLPVLRIMSDSSSTLDAAIINFIQVFREYIFLIFRRVPSISILQRERCQDRSDHFVISRSNRP